MIKSIPMPDSKAGIKYDFSEDCTFAIGLRDGSNTVLLMAVDLSPLNVIGLAEMACCS